ncbi:hypothetical protein SASPL_120802 [Salvia splendens]|uniref:Uncharacterized protein n=1 Tax=Salvia splendens TaxID=180675 RepID=A0A8X8XRF8_SALSN|nr:hypothetical protein SASPL_120802 [Salvia splendens]
MFQRVLCPSPMDSSTIGDWILIGAIGFPYRKLWFLSLLIVGQRFSRLHGGIDPSSCRVRSTGKRYRDLTEESFMANRIVSHTESIVVTCGNCASMLEPFPSSPSALDTPALAFEHILASLARLEARMDALERRSAIAQPPPWPDPDPPYTDWNLGRGNSARERPMMTAAKAVTQQPLLGFGGPSSRGQCYGTSFGEPYDPSGETSRGRQPTSWDDKKRKQDHVIDRGDDPKPKTKKAYLLEIAKKYNNV